MIHAFELNIWILFKGEARLICEFPQTNATDICLTDDDQLVIVSRLQKKIVLYRVDY